METIFLFIQSNLASITAAVIISQGIVLIVLVVLLFQIKRIKNKSKVFFEGKNGKDLEAVVSKNIEEIKSLDRDIQDLYDISNQVNGLAEKSIYKVGTIRFNPFKDIGGDQSFSVAFLNGNNSGLVISSLHTREGTRVYTKPIEEGKSKKYLLTKEEEEAIKKAVSSQKTKK